MHIILPKILQHYMFNLYQLSFHLYLHLFQFSQVKDLIIHFIQLYIIMKHPYKIFLIQLFQLMMAKLLPSNLYSQQKHILQFSIIKMKVLYFKDFYINQMHTIIFLLNYLEVQHCLIFHIIKMFNFIKKITNLVK